MFLFLMVVEGDSGVEFLVGAGVEAAAAFSALARDAGLEPAAAALTWLAQLPGVSTVIPGARNAEQATANAAAGSARPLPASITTGIHEIYDEYFRSALADRW